MSSNIVRITGLASGLDVEGTVKKLMVAETAKVDKVKQARQLLQWKQDAYRDVISSINSFKSAYFEVLNPSTYMLSNNNYSAFNVTSSDTTNSSATATALTGATTGTYKLSNITLAKAASISNPINETENSLSVPVTIDSTNNTSSINLNGTQVTATIAAGTYNTTDDLVAAIHNALTGAVDIGGSPHDLTNGSYNGAKFDVLKTTDGTRLKFLDQNDVDKITLSGNSMTTLGFSTSIVNLQASSSDKITSFYNSTAAFTVNGVNFNYDFTATGAQKDWTISQVNNDISSKANVKMSFSELGQKFTLASSTTGVNQNLKADDSTGNFLQNILGTSNVNAVGSDASVTITDPNGNTSNVNKSGNMFTIDNVTYNLLQSNSTDTISLSVTANVQKTFDTIKGMVDKYNDLITKIQTKLDERKQTKYPPLTDEQKKDMTADQITSWETQAQVGILSNDGNLKNLLSNLRSAFYDTVKPNYSDDPTDKTSIGISLTDIGLSTSNDFTQGGKIMIDENKLKTAIQNNGSQVAQLLSKQSTSSLYYNVNLSATDKKHRYQEEGIFQRLSDIIQNNITTSSNSSGNRGILVDQSGIKGDFTEFNNLLAKQLKDSDAKISTMTKSLDDKETAYYTKFSKLEVAMQKLNSQSSWLSQQVSSM